VSTPITRPLAHLIASRLATGERHGLLVGRFRTSPEAEHAVARIRMETPAHAHLVHIDRMPEGLRAWFHIRNTSRIAIVTAWASDPAVRLRVRMLLRLEGAIETRADATANALPQFAHGFSEVEPQLRAEWTAEISRHDVSWNDVLPRYLLGWQLARRPDYRGRSWAEASSNIRSEWERRDRTVPWKIVAAQIERGWAAARSADRTAFASELPARKAS
jgi:hypothetical protein